MFFRRTGLLPRAVREAMNKSKQKTLTCMTPHWQLKKPGQTHDGFYYEILLPCRTCTKFFKAGSRLLRRHTSSMVVTTFRSSTETRTTLFGFLALVASGTMVRPNPAATRLKLEESLVPDCTILGVSPALWQAW